MPLEPQRETKRGFGQLRYCCRLFSKRSSSGSRPIKRALSWCGLHFGSFSSGFRTVRAYSNSGRADACFSNNPRINSSTALGISGSRCRGRVGMASRCLAARSEAFSEVKAGWPTNSSYRSSPREYRSASRFSCFVSMYSGAAWDRNSLPRDSFLKRPRGPRKLAIQLPSPSVPTWVRHFDPTKSD